MAMMFEEDKRRLMCECGNGYLYKKELYTYLTDTKDKNALQERLIETHLLRAASVIALSKRSFQGGQEYYRRGGMSACLIKFAYTG